MMSRGSSSELEMPDGGAPTPLKVEIEETGFPPGIWKILLGAGGWGWGGWCCMKRPHRECHLGTGSWRGHLSACQPLTLPLLLSATPSPTTTLAPQQLAGPVVIPGLSSLSWRLDSW